MLVAKSGPMKGTSWPLSERPLIIGRGRGCDIIIPDPLISRRHCELVVKSEGVRLADLGSSNLTLVNGESVRQCRLKPGDEIAVGSVVFMLVQALVPEAYKVPDDNHTQAFRAFATPSPDSNPSPSMGKLQTIREYADLFSACRHLSRATTVTELVEGLTRSLSPRFDAEFVRVARFNADEEEPTLFPPLAVTTRERSVISARALRRVFDTQKPWSSKEPPSERANQKTVLIAPMAVGQERIAVLALQSRSVDLASDESALDFFAALAHQIAPLFHTIAQLENLRRDNERLRVQAGESATLVGDSKALRHVRALVRQAAQTHLPVLILGETGTGKELVARSVHDLSNRASGPFVALNCAAIPSQLFESELFGHVKGAFTDANQARVGRFEQAHGGTLFLDEIGDLSPENQARILRAIEQGTFHRVGAQEETRVDVRIVAATNEDLMAAIERDEFRLDLYHRLNGFQIDIPPLRERPSDIPVLAEHFLEFARQRAKHPINGFEPEALEYLKSRMWPGNVRELRNCIERAVARARHELIVVEDLVQPGGTPMHKKQASLPTTLAEMEKEHIARVLKECAGNVSAAARVLEIHRNTLYNKIAQYGIEV